MDPSALRAVTAPAPLRKQVVESLREAIVQGLFKPGERLRERELCERLGVSRTSLREGLVELESEGLIENVPNRGPTVALISLKLAHEVYELRAVIEALAARMFARRASDEQLARLEHAVADLQVVYDDFAAGPFLKAKSRFYDILLEGADNHLAAHTLRGIHARVSQLRVLSLSEPSRLRVSMAEILRIFESLKARDEDAAWQASYDHVVNAETAALASLKASLEEPNP
jgi:DNA-binding GntR family transcriptional regulator